LPKRRYILGCTARLGNVSTCEERYVVKGEAEKEVHSRVYS